ncbi:hypothetical protein [Halosimplex halophilum]|uniref:hypothetical protein n=1 Tax=Halosimplex halophilum TaxID=2559572 RepID=UPI00107F47BE|nr:hypothetical protein [Halosimplex halophilum]
MRLNVRQSLISNNIIHDELGHGIETGIIFDHHERTMLNNVWVMLDSASGGQRAFDWENTSKAHVIYNNVYIGESTNADGDLPEDVQLRGKDSIANNVIISNTGLDLSFADDFVFSDYVDSSVTHGTRTVVNGWSVNDGNPATTGQWNGHAVFAAKTKATVYDTSASSPLPNYSAQPDGSGGYEWIEESVTAA